MTMRAPGPESSTGTAPGTGRRKLDRRWAIPAAAVLGVATAVAGVAVAPQVAGAASRTLPSKTPQQLVAAVLAAQPRPLSGTVVETADLGLPVLPGGGSSTSPTSLLSGSHRVRLWYGSATRQRIAVLGDLAETDVVRDGNQAWLWSSSTNSAEHLLLPTAGTRGSGTPGTPDPTADPTANAADLTPPAAAARAVAAVTPTTRLSVDPTTRVAGRSAYELVLRPRDAGSLVDRVTVAVDAATSIPLRVAVYATGRSTPAFSTAFTSLTVAAPAASVFGFTPPAGSTVTTKDLRSATAPATTHRPDAAAGVHPVVTGRGWSSVVTVSGVDSAAAGTGTLGTVAQAATRVSGPFGSGRVLSTRLFSVLLLDDGRLLVGAVPASTLERAATR